MGNSAGLHQSRLYGMKAHISSKGRSGTWKNVDGHWRKGFDKGGLDWILFEAENLETQTSMVRGESVGAIFFEFGESLMLGYREFGKWEDLWQIGLLATLRIVVKLQGLGSNIKSLSRIDILGLFDRLSTC